MQKFTRAREDLHTPEETLRLADWKTLGQFSNKDTVGSAMAKSPQLPNWKLAKSGKYIFWL